MKRLLVLLCSLGLAVPVLAQRSPPMTRPVATPQEGKKEAAQVATLSKINASYKIAYTKHTNDAGARRKYVESTVNLGLFYVSAKSFPPSKQYPTALHYFRDALKLDPKNKVARDWKDQIEAIYKSMGKPIPPQE